METIPRKSLIKTRDAKISDQAFIYSSFLKGLYYGNDFYRSIDKDIFMREYKKVLEHLLIKSTTTVACLADDEDVVIGYAIYQPGVLHYSFVKPVWRKIGVAKSIIPVDINTVTHLTKIGKSIKPSAWKFDPWKI